MLFGLLAVVAFESRKMPTADWMRGKIVTENYMYGLYAIHNLYALAS